MLDLDLAAHAAPARHAAAPPFTVVQKRDGRDAPYDRDRIAHAVEMAFRAECGVPYPDALDLTIHDCVERVRRLWRRRTRAPTASKSSRFRTRLSGSSWMAATSRSRGVSSSIVRLARAGELSGG